MEGGVLGLAQAAGCCEYDDETSGSIKYGELWLAEKLLVF